jgi:putative ABC transport system permease protein
MRSLWIRWIARDLRQRWLLITSIALVLALGTGTYAALLGTSTWRTLSNDASFEQQRMHDLEISLAPGTTAPAGTLAELVDTVAGEDAAAVRERLVLPTQVVAGDVIVPGKIVGAGGPDEGPGTAVDLVWVAAGRAPGPDEPQPAGILEMKFADANGLPDQGTIRISGGTEIGYTGVGAGPEDFVVNTGGVGFFLADAGYATVYLPLADAQGAAGAPVVNNAVLRLTAESDRDDVQLRLEQALAAADPPLGATVTTRDDEVAYRVLYEDIEGDEQFWIIISSLMLLGATLAAVNLTVRVVEGQRREIGIGMALGKRPSALAVRPFAFGVAIAVLGVVLGLIVGRVLVIPLRDLYTSVLPLPVWETPFVLQPFLVASAIGVAVPLLAVAFPVVRAIRVEPVDAIRVGHLAAAGKGAGWAGLLRRLPMPGRSYWNMPIRNVVRTPRRTLLTAVGIGAAITVLVTLGGLLDSFDRTVAAAADETARSAPDRLTAALEDYRSVADPVVQQVAAIDGVASVSPELVLPAQATGPDGEQIDVLLQVLAPDAPWVPTIASGSASGGLVLAQAAASDLGVAPGDTLQLRHPELILTSGAPSIRYTDSDVPVAGVHPFPIRSFTYLDTGSAAFLGFTGVTNSLTVVPEAGADPEQVRRGLFAIPAVGAVTSQAETIEEVSAALDQILGILGVVAVVTLILALLIAFNSASIAAEERRREHATMLAYGLPVGRILTMQVVEGILIGFLGTLVGLGLGFLVVRYIVYVQLPQTLPEFGVVPEISAATVVLALGMGILAVSVAPLLASRRLRRMDVPGTLRVVE